VVPYDLVEWLEPLLKGAGEEAARSDVQLLVHPVDTEDRGVDPLLDRLGDIPTDALIMVDPWLGPEQEERLRAAGRPVVFFDDRTAHPWAASVGSANRDGGHQAGRHLAACGRRRIAVVTDDSQADYVVQRLDGLRAGLAEAGVAPAGEPVVVTGDGGGCRVGPKEGILGRILQEGAFDGVFAVADWLAAFVLRDLRRIGLAVPEDVSVVGFDDERIASLLDPPLTTIRQPTDAIGRRAVRLALRAAEGDAPEPGPRELPVELVVRESSMPPGA
jgi:DNA-binding LacI/PurR family transcriptional regulator